MANKKAMRLCDRVTHDGSRVVEEFDGLWQNSNPDSRGIVQIRIGVRGTDTEVEFFTATERPGVLRSWGVITQVALYSDAPDSARACGFTATRDFGFVEYRIQANLNKGLMVLCRYAMFKDDSGRNPYFVREYYRRQHNEEYQLESIT